MTRTPTLVVLAALCSVAACAAPRAAAPSPADASIAPKQATPDRADVRAALAVKRRAQIDRLRAYSAAGHFPKNNERPGMLNIFIGDDGAICAAANLMWQDGHAALVRTTAARDNYLRLATVTSGPLMDWMLGSGLTKAEIDRIQEPYGFVDEPAPEPLRIAQQQEVQRLQAHFAIVLAELEKSWNQSLDAATDLAMASPTVLASL